MQAHRIGHKQELKTRQLPTEDARSLALGCLHHQALFIARTQRQQRKRDKVMKKKCMKLQLRVQKELKRKKWWEAKRACKQKIRD